MSDQEREAIQALVDWTVGLLEQLEVESDYGLHAVAWIDQFIDRERENFPEATRERFVNGFGAYLGESIRRTYGGEWVKTERGWIVQIQSGNAKVDISCFGKVYKWMESGETGDSILGMFTALPSILNRMTGNQSNE